MVLGDFSNDLAGDLCCCAAASVALPTTTKASATCRLRTLGIAETHPLMSVKRMLARGREGDMTLLAEGRLNGARW
jgi:hypothetical protein